MTKTVTNFKNLPRYNTRLPIGSGSSRILMESLYKSLFVGNLRKDVKVKIKNDDDFLIHWTYDVSLFKTLEEWRDTKLEELGI